MEATNNEDDWGFYSNVVAPSRNSAPVQAFDSSKGRYRILNPKQKLLNLVCASLISEPSFFNDLSFSSLLPSRSDPYCTNSQYVALVQYLVFMVGDHVAKHEMLDLVLKISRRDCEFVLKLAHYVRMELGIRSTANFLLAAAAICPQSKQEYVKYYLSSIRLPSDWLEVCSFYVVIRRHLLRQWMTYHPDQTRVMRTLLKPMNSKEMENRLKELKDQVVPGRDIPHVLQKAMKEKFLDFDVYQLAKYNKEKSMKRKFLKKTYQERKSKAKQSSRTPEMSSARGRGRGRGRGCSRVLNNRNSRNNVNWEDSDEQGGEDIPNDQHQQGIDYDSEDSEEVIDSDEESVDHVERPAVKKEQGSKKLKPSGELNNKPQFSMKKMIRQLHMTEPSEFILSILGKKYPSTEEEFTKQNLDKAPLTRVKGKRKDTELRQFDPLRVGTRMKLPVPVTWETELSATGNNATSWQNLIDSGKLPFMAMLRNLRNLLLTGISTSHHEVILNKLRDADTIKHSQQFPFRFFSAYQSIDIDLKQLRKYKKMSRDELAEMEATTSKIIIPENMPTEDLIKEYREALDKAVQHAVTNNIKQIQGTTAIFVDVSESMKNSVCSSAKAGNFTSAIEIGVLLGLMCNFVCQQSEFMIYSSPSLIYPDSNYQNMTSLIKQGHILENMKLVLRRVEQMGSVREFPLAYLKSITDKKTIVDQIVVLSDMQWDKDNAFTDSFVIQSMITQYRKKVNPNMLFICIDLFGSGSTLVNMNEGQTDPRNITITGFSDSILRFIAEKSDNAQLRHVQNIEVREPVLLLPAKKNNKKKKKSKGKKKKESHQPVLPLQNEVRFLSTPFKNQQSILVGHSFKKVLSKSKHCIFLTNEGAVYGMGKSGSIFSSNVEQPRLMLDQDMIRRLTEGRTKGEHVIDITSGTLHIAALTNLGTVFVMGCNTDNQLGRSTDTDYINDMKPVIWENPTHITSVACGDYYTVFLTKEGKLFGCGRNDNRQMGDFIRLQPNMKVNLFPQEIELSQSMSQITAISAGSSHTAVLDKNGNLWMMGNNSHGQCGLGTCSSISSLTRITDFDRSKLQNKDKIIIKSVSCGEYHTAALTVNGILYVFGSDYCGQLGVREQRLNECKPRRVLGYPTDFIETVECSKYYTTVVTKHGTVYTSGSDSPSSEDVKLCSPVPTGSSVMCASFGEEFKVLVVESRLRTSKNNLKMLSNGNELYNMKLNISENTSVHLHEYMIEQRCPLFPSVLCNRLGTIANVTEYNLKQEYQSTSERVLTSLVEFIYTDHIGFYDLEIKNDMNSTPLSEEEQKELQKLAKLLQLTRLEELCSGKIVTTKNTLAASMVQLLSHSNNDCLIETSTNPVPCHAALLAAQSEYLNSVLLYEKVSSSINQNVIRLKIDQVDNASTIRAIVHFIYTGKLNQELINSDNALDVLRAADLLCLKELREEMESFLMNFIDRSNVSVVLEHADYYDWLLLRQKLILYIIREGNIKEIFGQKAFQELRRNNILLADEIQKFSRELSKEK